MEMHPRSSTKHVFEARENISTYAEGFGGFRERFQVVQRNDCAMVEFLLLDKASSRDFTLHRCVLRACMNIKIKRHNSDEKSVELYLLLLLTMTEYFCFRDSL